MENKLSSLTKDVFYYLVLNFLDVQSTLTLRATCIDLRKRINICWTFWFDNYNKPTQKQAIKRMAKEKREQLRALSHYNQRSLMKVRERFIAHGSKIKMIKERLRFYNIRAIRISHKIEEINIYLDKNR